MSRVMIMAGGTGGHVFPALAVAEVLRSRGNEVSWMGTAKGIEARLVPAADIKLNLISVQGLRGNGLMGWLTAPFKLVKAVLEARQHLKNFAPDVVLGLGGFASGPGGIAAWLSKTPLVIHEQNAIAGLTNRLLSPFSKAVLLGFANSIKSAKAQWVGNPVRAAIENIPAPELRYQNGNNKLNILVLGGSLGARSLNETVPAALATIPEAERPNVLHQCGERHLAAAKESYQKAGVAADVTAFIDDMAASYANADLVICRAGALTIAEVAAAGVASILVPYPYAVDDHQTVNAEVLTNAGAGILIQDADLNVEALANIIKELNSDRSRLLSMAKSAREQARIGSAEVIANICMEQLHG